MIHIDGPLLGKGRACDVYEHGPGKVLRRERRGRDCSAEADLMVALSRSGQLVVPEIYESAGPDIVMARVDGPTMLGLISSRPHKVRSLAKLLADLHRQVASAPVPTDLAQLRGHEPSGDDVIAHMDLHPDNVIMSADGPVVIDWANGCRAPAGFDAAHTRLTMATSVVDEGPVMKAMVLLLRRALVSTFARSTADLGPERHLAAAAEHRLADRNVTPPEQARLRDYL